jgi:hypothetical protein
MAAQPLQSTVAHCIVDAKPTDSRKHLLFRENYLLVPQAVPRLWPVTRVAGYFAAVE